MTGGRPVRRDCSRTRRLVSARRRPRPSPLRRRTSTWMRLFFMRQPTWYVIVSPPPPSCVFLVLFCFVCLFVCLFFPRFSWYAVVLSSSFLLYCTWLFPWYALALRAFLFSARMVITVLMRRGLPLPSGSKIPSWVLTELPAKF